MDALKRAEKELNEMSDKALNVGYLVSIMALNKNYGWKKLRISRFLEVSHQIYDEVSSSNSLSLIQMCNDEANIEIRSDANEPYEEKFFLNNARWELFKPTFKKMPPVMQRAYFTRMRQKQKEWMFPQVMAGVILALYRKEKWSSNKIGEFIEFAYGYRREYEDDVRLLRKAVEELTDLRFKYTEQGEFALLMEE